MPTISVDNSVRVQGSTGAQVGVGVQTKLTNNIFGRIEVAGTYYAPQTFDFSGSPYWQVFPSTITVNAGVGSTF